MVRIKRTNSWKHLEQVLVAVREQNPSSLERGPRHIKTSVISEVFSPDLQFSTRY